MAQELQLVVVTPETTVLNETVTSLRFPLYDGMIGVLPGRTPLVGRLGYGELTFRTDKEERRFYIDGGFAQIKGATVSLLTDRAIPAEKISVADAENQLNQARAVVAKTDAEAEQKDRDQVRARRMISMSRS
ncbi:MAG: ATP synthase F1 subunit epsilon [Planctomycetota bacterium]|nr:ATP synthase F1 subunit epsilon [Planctomycetota bacterium]MDA1211969.1 ATP synthase F1 subunit epsilon [Planctomycetota bacterium]